MSTFPERLFALQATIAEALRRSGRRAEEVELVAVSKGHPASSIVEALASGQMLFGESRVQEARPKMTEATRIARWHFIGHLQKNKVRQALPLFEMLESVHSYELAATISRIAGELALRPRVLLEVNISGEESKQGFAADDLRARLSDLWALPHLQIEGLMTIPPYGEEVEKSRPFFAGLRQLRDELARTSGRKLPALSMGMSGDYAVAIEEGATLVRVGTALFGERASAA